MTNASAPSRQPVSLSFKEFRDEEIVEFFANESRSFRPDSRADGSFCRSRIVGAPHFARNPKKDVETGQKPTAAFRCSIRFCDENALPEEKTSDNLSDEKSAIRVARIPDPLKRKRKASVEPAFGKPTRPLGSLLVSGRSAPSNKESRAARIVRDPLEKSRMKKENRPEKPGAASFPVETAVLERLQETDQRLRQLIESWPMLPAQLKETIATLIEVSDGS